jgi:release factor glutamine methyltransferase
MKIAAAERYIRQQLSDIYDERESGNIANMVIEHITGYTRLDRITKKEDELTTDQTDILQQYIQRLLQHEPVQYVLQEAWFYGMKLYVNHNVLIPRPETEELVQWIIDDIKASGKDVFVRRKNEADETTQLKILDVGSGSGCIALALKKAMPKADIWGCDISDEALTIARRNGADLDIRVDFVAMNFLDTAQQLQLPIVDVIVSNPPYIPLKDKAQMQQNVVAHEPHTALFVPDNDALLFYRAIIEFAKKRLYETGSIYAEIHEDLSEAVVQLFSEAGFQNVQLKKDMQGKDRMVKAASFRKRT